MLKRNDICHCGSGKKYKKCCMEKDKAIEKAEKEERALTEKKQKIDKKYTDSIVKLSNYLDELIDENENFANKEEEAHKEFFGEMQIDNIAADRFFASYFSYDYLIDDKNTPAIYALKNGNFSEDERRIISGCINSYPSLFVIEKMEEKKILIKDLFAKNTFETLDSQMLKEFAEGDYILARPVYIDGVYLLTDLTIRIQEDVKELIYRGIIDVYENNKNSIPSLERFVVMNSLFFYKYMLQLIQLSDYNGQQSEEISNKIENSKKDDEKNESNESTDDKFEALENLLKNNISDEEIYFGVKELLDNISEKINVSGSEYGWASGLEYCYRKSIGESVTQSAIAKSYGVSSSTLAKRNKEILIAVSGEYQEVK
ncbi:SEC-C domain-containing protein [Peptostreptococcus faecalis]|uniref:SEC-C domain-containing protein n=1 Tax=Peptostreptococcus faecalis TaxID=2045015 RepID=UPI000C798C15|nr:SEC-C domain-containing protein [Peptostreptococcus faecalis]